VYYAVSPQNFDPPFFPLTYQVKYARITGFKTPQQSISNIALSDVFDLEDITNYPPGFGRWMGDYTMADCRGCDVYLGYTKPIPGQGRSVYVSKVRICPPTD